MILAIYKAGRRDCDLVLVVQEVLHFAEVRLKNISLYLFTTPTSSSVVREECLKHFT